MLIHLHRISRSYGRVQALSEVSLELEPGVIGLVGNNGAGKSTLLKILLGLLAPDSGTGTILGYDVRRASRHIRGRVGYMAEAASTVPLLKGAEFVTLAGDLYGMPHRDARRRAHEVLNYVGLGELRYRRLEEYSTGNLQRLKLAAALVHDPDLLLLDEPTNGLDPAGRLAMLQVIQDLIAETGKSVILCTHLLGDVQRLCEQVVVLHGGRVLLSGPMSELPSQPHSRFELGWQGDGESFMVALRRAGVQLETEHGHHRVFITMPADWTTSDLFKFAASAGAAVSHLKPEEEDLQQMFLRITGAPDDAGDNAPTNPPLQESARGN